MDLKALHSLMSSNKFYYFSGNTNSQDNDIYISFSKLHNGRGDSVSFRIGQTDNDVSYYYHENNSTSSMNNASDIEIFSFIYLICNIKEK